MTDNLQYFPPEIIEQIISFVGEEYLASVPRFAYGKFDLLRTLIAFTLVSRAFYAACVGYIFRSVQIGDGGVQVGPNFSQRVADLFALMASDSTTGHRGIAPYIKEFSIGVSGRALASDHDGPPSVEAVDAGLDPTANATEEQDDNTIQGPPDIHGRERTNAMKILADQNLPKLFDALHSDEYGIDNLSFQVNTFRNVKWHDLPMALRNSLHSLLHSHHLRTVNIYRISKLPNNIWNGTAIKDLRLSSMDLTEDNDPVPDTEAAETTLPIPTFDCLFTDQVYKFDLSPATSPLRSLKKLQSYSILPQHYINSEAILRIAAKTLEDVRLEFSGELFEHSLTI